MPNKGTPFEREICKELSLWWTRGEREDVFWRTDTSGGRATQRAKQGKGTFGQHGDVQATDPFGQPLIDLCLLELKRGYSKFTIADLIDKPNHAAIQKWEGWIGKLQKQAEEVNTPFWMIIAKRDRREKIVMFPYGLSVGLTNAGAAIHQTTPFVEMSCSIKGLSHTGAFAIMSFKNFLGTVKPNYIRRVKRSMDMLNGK